MGNKTAVIYHYFEKDRSYRDNLVYFLANGICQKADFFVIISGDCSIDLPEFENVRYIHAPNRNNDFGGYAAYARDYFCDSYDFHVFVNSSVRGPFLPTYYEEPWTTVFTRRLDGDTHLVGSSINVIDDRSGIIKAYKESFPDRHFAAHVQTTSYALTREALMHLIDADFYASDRELDKMEVIVHYELHLSSEIMHRGWKINAILPVYENVDYVGGRVTPENTSARYGDVLWKSSFFSRSLSPLEAVFIKTNRDIIDEVDLASFTFTGLHRALNEGPRFDAAHRLMEECYLHTSEAARALRDSENNAGLKAAVKRKVKSYASILLKA